MHNPLTRLAVVPLLLCGLAASCTAPDDPSLPHYDIRLFRTVAVGDHFTVMFTIDCDMRMGTTSGGPPSPALDVVLKSSITAEAAVLATAADGRSLKTSYLVMASTHTIGTKTSEIVPVGTEIIFEKSGNDPSRITVAGDEASPALRLMLLPLFGQESYQGASDDAFFGTKQPKKVGDAWPVDSASGAAFETEAIAKLPITINPASITGTVTLAEVNAGTMKVVSDFTIDLPALPQQPGVTVTSFASHGRFTGTVPLDVTKHTLSSVMSLGCHMECTLKSSSQVADFNLTRLAVYLPR